MKLRHPRIAICLAAAGLVLAALPANAAVTEVTFSDYVPLAHEGSFDLDLQVWNGYSGSSGWTFGVQSYTDWANSYFQVRTMFGAVQHTNDTTKHTFVDTKEMNSPQTTALPASDPHYPADVRWAHEVPSVSYDARTSYKKWLQVHSTAPKLLPTSDHQLGENLSEYGWIGGKKFSNTSNSFPDPDYTTVPTKEDRWFCGYVCDWDAMSTTGWAENTPQEFHCPPYANGSCAGQRVYLAYSEPGIIDDGNGTTYLAVAGYHNAAIVEAEDYRADILLFKSTNNGTDWSFGGKLLDYTDADDFNANYSYFTAPSMHVHDSAVWLDASPADIDYAGVDNPAPYQGMIEFKITSLTTPQVQRDGCSGTCGTPTDYLTISDSTSPHDGAGGFYPPTATHHTSKYFVGTGSFPYSEDIFRVWEAGV